MPLLVGYWLTIGRPRRGVRPSEPRASWIFNAAGIGEARAFRSGTRAAFLAIVLLSSLTFTGAAITPLLGWRITMWHAAYVLVILVANGGPGAPDNPSRAVTAIYRPRPRQAAHALALLRARNVCNRRVAGLGRTPVHRWR
jgi:hypothetical protein